NLYDYLAHNPLPQVECPREGYEIFRYLLCQATAARRKRLLEAVARWGLALYGNWRDSVSYNSSLREGLKGPLPIEEEPSLFAQGGIFINIHSVGHVTGPNMRFFNVPGMGGFLLSDGQFGDYLRDGQEMVSFHSEKELVEKVAYYLQHPAEMDEIRHNGHARVCQDWTYSRWLDEVFAAVKGGSVSSLSGK
ncbi:MAG: glycosyltransferase, partial [bacterium]|nr:glycosyltransferase [bacterium]